MPAPEQIYEGSVRVFSLLMLVLGVAILVTTIVAGGGPLSVGFLLGVAFVAVGGGRLYITSRSRRP